MRRLFGFILGLTAVAGLSSSAWAADLDVQSKRVVVRVHHHKLMRVVRDYDGTPVAMRRRPGGIYDTYVAMRASPTRYLNGQRVMP